MPLLRFFFFEVKRHDYEKRSLEGLTLTELCDLLVENVLEL
jgi:hypothetical protein